MNHVVAFNLGLDNKFARPEKTRYWQEQMMQILRQGCHAKTDFTLGEIVTNLLQKETELDLDQYDLYFTLDGAQETIRKILREIITPQKNEIALPSPNWLSGHLLSGVQDAVLRSFFADREQSYATWLDSAASGSTCAHVTVTPSNPLCMTFKPSTNEDIESIEEKHGIIRICDNIFISMGSGTRYHEGTYSKNAILVESTTKRWSILGLGLTWVLVPKNLGLRFDNLEIGCEGCKNIAALYAKALMDCHYDYVVQSHYEERLNAFREGFLHSVVYPEIMGEFISPSNGAPFFNFSSLTLNSSELSSRLMMEPYYIRARPGASFIVHDEFREIEDYERLRAETYIRFAHGAVTVDQARKNGHYVGDVLKEMKKWEP